MQKCWYDGLRFVGITEESKEIPCVVREKENGWGIALSEIDGERVWAKLIGWRPYGRDEAAPYAADPVDSSS